MPKFLQSFYSYGTFSLATVVISGCTGVVRGVLRWPHPIPESFCPLTCSKPMATIGSWNSPSLPPLCFLSLCRHSTVHLWWMYPLETALPGSSGSSFCKCHQTLPSPLHSVVQGAHLVAAPAPLCTRGTNGCFNTSPAQKQNGWETCVLFEFN